MTKGMPPVTDVTSDPFWEGARAGRLMIQRCPVTGMHQWYPRAHSIHSPGASPEWVEASGQGTIFSFTTIQRGMSAFETPYTCVLVMLDEGVLVLSRLEAEPGADIRVGMPVEAFFGEVQGTPDLPLFRIKGDRS
ncbi:hypothetical protein EV667_0970 [Ancylobacter aquaticus]|uniref:Zn-ribbon domain-containing OB-fold protein n=1 Tax=Ancylobacter aquaticus TaxID=100 RepID=A0A4V2PK34_ANCAQ|nr:OB-fold domain-containing protein [Ancylobacter aquaticus]TCK30866.1 hypothetical protein EV667_0970 [Ancylobacter aquaticus]